MEASDAPVIDTPRAAPPAQSGRAADPTFAIAFGGGGARGLAHIHVIEALVQDTDSEDEADE